MKESSRTERSLGFWTESERRTESGTDREENGDDVQEILD